MNKLFKILLVAGFAVLTVNFAKAQSRTGYVYFNTLVDAMPDKATVGAAVQEYQKQFINVLQGMQADHKAKIQDFEKNKAVWNDAIKQQKADEIAGLEDNIQNYNNKASQQVEAKYAELMQPVLDKVKIAVAAVAKEKGYTLIFDASVQAFIVAPETDDLTAAVKLKLGIK